MEKEEVKQGVVETKLVAKSTKAVARMSMEEKLELIKTNRKKNDARIKETRQEVRKLSDDLIVLCDKRTQAAVEPIVEKAKNRLQSRMQAAEATDEEILDYANLQGTVNLIDEVSSKLRECKKIGEKQLEDKKYLKRMTKGIVPEATEKQVNGILTRIMGDAIEWKQQNIEVIEQQVEQPVDAETKNVELKEIVEETETTETTEEVETV